MARSLLGGSLFALGLTFLGCATTSDEAPPEADTEALSTLAVHGHALTAVEATWMRFVASDVLPHLRGTREERLTIASQAAWWALKEGDWQRKTAAGYSLCNGTSGDRLLSPLQTCIPHRAWQVGIAGVQVPGHTVADLEALAHSLYPDLTLDALLESTAALAGHAPGSETSRGIIASTGSLRASWLLRVPAIGFTVANESEVVPECIRTSMHWCYGTSWDETRKFAPSRQGALAAIADIHALLAQLATTP